MKRILAAMGLGAALLSPALAAAEVSEVRLTQQYGLSYLPLVVARTQNLVEKHAKAAGIDTLKVTYSQLGGGAAVNDALLSGAVDFGAAGLGPAFTAWDKSRGEIKVAAALDSNAVFLTTINPAVKSIRDFSDKDRIAVPAVKVSIQSVLLQIAAEKEFGPGKHDALDKYTVSLKHPDATAALLAGNTELTAHFGQLPYSFQQLENPKVHSVLSSTDILGAPASLNVLYATSKFREQNPKVYGAVIAALREADSFIAANKAQAARIYVEEEKPNVSPEYIERILADPKLSGFSVAPLSTFPIADFLYRTGALKTKPNSWKDYSFPNLHSEAGS